MGRESSDLVRFDLGPLLQGQTRIMKLKYAYNLLIIGPRGLQCETNLWEIMGWESSDVVRFVLGPPPSRSHDSSLALVSCLSSGYYLHQFSNALGLVIKITLL